VLAINTTATLIARNPILFTCPLDAARGYLLKFSIVAVEPAVRNGLDPAVLGKLPIGGRIAP
jgi:hypothetical protein